MGMIRPILLVVLASCLMSCGSKDGGQDDATDDGVPEDVADDADADGGEIPDAPADTDYDSEGMCPPGHAWNPYSTPPRCVECPRACGMEGETGEPWEITALSGDCVCTTEDGYYFSLAGAGVSHSCDMDDDGWITLSARSNIESEDPAIADNARCDLRTVGRFVLLAEDESPGDGCTVLLSDTDLGVSEIELYEPAALDDQVLLDGESTVLAYGERKPFARELNALTKACVGEIGDFNSNTISDLSEDDLSGGPMDAFGYFIELHKGWYEDGAYHIQERTRADVPSAALGLPLRYNDEGHWRSCLRMTDGDFDPAGSVSIGMDFARYSSGSYDAGMLHHSQFKCVRVVPRGTPLDAENPQLMPLGQLELSPRRYLLNSCGAEPESVEPDPGTANPAHMVLACEVNTAPAVDDVGFVAVKYIHYDDPTGYVRGCVNGCVHPTTYSCADPRHCEPDILDYGLPECVCWNAWEGTACDVCPPYWDDGGTAPGDPAGCLDCQNHFDPLTDCTDCLPNWDVSTLCITCYDDDTHGHWYYDSSDESTSCTTCTNHWDISTGCTSCLDHYDASTGCTDCFDDDTNGHWDPITNCRTCLWNWDVSSTPTGCTRCLLDFDSTTSCRETSNLLLDAGAEDCVTTPCTCTLGSITAPCSAHPHWTVPGGGGTPEVHTETCSGAAPDEGSYVFRCCTPTCIFEQGPVDVSSYAYGIDAGDRFRVNVVFAHYLSPSSQVDVTLYFYDSVGAEIANTRVTQTYWSPDDAWGTRSFQVAIPVAAGISTPPPSPPSSPTRSIKVQFTARNAAVAVDDIILQIIE